MRKITATGAVFVAGVFTAIGILNTVVVESGVNEMTLIPITIAVFSFIAGMGFANVPDETRADFIASITAARVQRVVQETIQSVPAVGVYDSAALSAALSGISERLARLEQAVHTMRQFV